MTCDRVGDPPPLRGRSPRHLYRFAIACRASAIILDLEGHGGPASQLRDLADAAAQRGDDLVTQVHHPALPSAA